MRLPLLLLALTIVLAGAAAGTGGTTSGQQVPTPRGHLGGPERLEPTPLLPTPIPTPTPPPPATPSPSASPSLPTSPATLVSEHTENAAPEEVATLARPAVVVVVAVDGQAPEGTPSPAREVAAVGSGFVFDAAGHVLTDAEVLGDRREVVIFLADGERRAAQVVGSDPLTGVAVLRVDGTPPPALPLTAAAPRPGETVVALGAPRGELPARVDVGSISAVGHAADPASAATALIRFDAPSLDGLGGGPVLNLRGGLVGMRLARPLLAAEWERCWLPDIELPDLPNLPDLPDAPPLPLPGVASDRPVASSVAVPATTLDQVAADVIAEGRVRHPYLGVRLAAVTPRLAVERGMPEAGGGLILGVEPNGPAAVAGLRPDDVIVALDGERIDAERSFAALLFDRRPGDLVRLAVRRGNDEIEIDAVLGERPEA